MLTEAASAHRWLMHSLLSTKTPGASQQSCSPESQATACVVFNNTTPACCWEGRLWVLPSWGSRLLLEGSSSQWQDFAFVPFLIHIMLVSPFFELTFQWPCLYQLLLPIYCHPQTWLQHTQFLFINKGDNRAGPSRYHYATPLVACFQLKYDPLTITLWAQSCN